MQRHSVNVLTLLCTGFPAVKVGNGFITGEGLLNGERFIKLTITLKFHPLNKELRDVLLVIRPSVFFSRIDGFGRSWSGSSRSASQLDVSFPVASHVSWPESGDSPTRCVLCPRQHKDNRDNGA